MSILDRPDAVAAYGVICSMDGYDPADMARDTLWQDRVRYAVSRGAVDVALDIAHLENADIATDQINALENAWRRGVAEFEKARHNRGIRVQVVPVDVENDHRIAAALSKAQAVDSIVFVDKGLAGADRWGWPLTVRSVGGEIEAAIQGYYHPQLLHYSPVIAPGEACDLLIVESLGALHSLADQGISAGFLLVLLENTVELRVDRVRGLNDVVGFRAAAVVGPVTDVQYRVQLFIDELSHNHSPDIAITHAIDENTQCVIVGDPAFLNQARVSVASANLIDHIEREFSAGAIDATQFTGMTEYIQSLPQPKEMQYWTSEGQAATETAQRSEPVMEDLGAGDGPVKMAIKPTERFLQAQVFEKNGDEFTQRTQSFEAGAPHRIKVRIGPSSLNWIVAPIAFPDSELPTTEARLTVTLLAPALAEIPQSQEILIGSTGTSTVAAFDVLVPPTLTQIDATVIVYCGGKHLQTGVLSGPVTGGEDQPGATGIDFVRGVPSGAELDDQKSFDLVVWKNGAELDLTVFDPGAPSGTPSNKSLHPSLGGVTQVVDSMRAELFDAASKIQQLETGLEQGGLKTLRALAEQGEFLVRKLLDPQVVSRIQRVQVVSPDSSDFFPVEFFYDHVLPDPDAKLCPEFKKTSSCECSGNCHAAKGDAGFVCPSGFWSLNRIIERQVRPLDRADSRQPESSGRSPGLQFPKSVIFAASDIVNEDNPDETTRTVEDMDAVLPVHHAHTWKQLADLVGSHYPALLVALPHNIESSPFNKLQISAAEELALNRIRPDYVVPATTDAAPLMLLLGCNTANSAVGYQDFVNEMRCEGAAVVVATLTYVLGPQAAPMAREFVRQIASAGTRLTIGEIMRRVRARMLAKDNIMALAITAFGDADWRFVKEES